VNTAALRTLVIYAIILPLAVFIGWMLSGDMTKTNFSVLAAIVFVLLLPVLLKWHYPAMLFAWNSSISIFFLPGKPSLWMLMAVITVAIAVLYRIIEKRQAFIPAPSLSISLLCLLGVVVFTAMLRGGVGIKAFGAATYGGKAYYFIIAAVIAYFALVSRPISPKKIPLYLALFLLPGLTGILSHLVYYAGPSFYILYTILPSGFAGFQAMTENTSIVRVGGLWAASSAITNYLLAVHGVRGVLRNGWRLALLFSALAMGTLGGFRSVLLFFALLFMILFFMEGLLRSPIFPAFLLVGALGFALLMPIASKLPLSMQRTLSILPLELDPIAKRDAEGSVDWRVEMWKVVLPELHKYTWFGKGFALNPTDVYLTEQAMLRHRAPGYAGAKLAGDYHSGPLSVFVPFGGIGSVAFVLFIAMCLRALHRNYHYSDPETRIANRFLYAYFLTRLIFFLGVFGSLYSDLYHFVGCIGLSVAINGGIRQRSQTLVQPVRFRGNLKLREPQPSPA
jgi:hypothetical protein